jgi:hypothetical protein
MNDAELAETIRNSSLGTTEIMDAILAAGYRKPRAITTAEELDALAIRSVILDCDLDICRKNRYGRWESFDEPDQTWSSTGLAGCLPATVLHEPDPS